jgi:superfamily II DNA or RNA helicase
VKYWPHQDAIKAENRRIASQTQIKKWVVPAPCGAGKTAMMIRDITDAVRKGFKVALYSCRIQNTAQMIAALEKTEIRYGVMASAFRGRRDIHAPVQICQVQTCFRRKKIFEQADLVFVDECHQQMSDSALWCLRSHEASGARFIVGWSATPVGWKRFYDHCCDPPTHQSLLDCKSHLACNVFAPDLPESVIRGRLRVQKNGEISSQQDARINNANVLQTRVYSFLDRFNPDRLPSVGFGPDVETCRNYVQMGLDKGIRCASIDADRVVLCERTESGEYQIKHYDSNLANRERVLRGSERGEFVVVWNRFILREAVDMVWLKHCIVATTMCGISTYLQSVGRVLRYFPDYDEVTVQDHGGNVWMHGYPNQDHDWLAYGDGPKPKKKSKPNDGDGDGDGDGDLPETRTCMKCFHASNRIKGIHNCPNCGEPFSKPVWQARNEQGDLFYVEPDKAKKSKASFEKIYRSKIYAAINTGASVRWAWAQAQRTARMKGVKVIKPHQVQGIYVPSEGSREWNQSVSHVFKNRKK